MSTSGPIANLISSSQLAGSKVPQHVLVVDASGNPATFGGSGGTSAADSGTFTATSTLGTPVMGAYEATPDTLTSGQLGIIGLDVDRNVKVNVVAGGTAGTQYTEGDTDASITGTALLMEGAGNALVVAQGTAADGLLVNLGSNNDVTVSGSVAVTDNSGSLTVDNPALSITGGGTESGALRVTLASDSTGVVSVDDNGGSLTVDGTVTANLSATDNAVLDTIAAPVATVSSTPLMRVAVFDASDTQITSFGGAGGGGTEYTEDAAAAANPVGGALIGRRRDTLSSEVSADGDNVALNATAKGELYVKHVDSVPVTDNGGSLTVDGTVAVSGTVAVTDNAGSLTVDNAALSVTGGGVESSALRVTIASDSTGVVSVDDNGSTLSIDDGGGSLTVDNGGTFAVQAAQSGTWNVGTVTTITNAVTAVGNAAHDAAVSGNPVLVAAEARSSDGTAVASGDVVRVLATLLGKQVTYPWALPGSTWGYAAASGGITNTTGVTAKAAAGAGVRNYITQVQAINGHATVSTDVQIRDGASGTVLWRGFAQASGGGCAAKFDPPLRGTANTLVEVACGTTGSATYINLQGFTSAE